ncbi:MAG TPA: sensor histidine kinase [Gemmatimonadaceae bacterium]|nr:sensor histidine kinase [Gemmatimonadaceae bacterium]
MAASTQVSLRSRLERAPAHERAEAAHLPRWLRALLGVPLMVKIIGANVLIVLIASAIALGVHDLRGPGRLMAVIMIVALMVSLLVNLALVFIAFRPLLQLEETAGRVWRGDLDARVPHSIIADRDMARVGGTINVLLDGLVTDRARMRRLASQVIGAQDEERARIARELHDSTAQTLAALMLQLSAAVRDSRDPALAVRLAEIKAMAETVLEEVRTLSHTVHPRVLDDLGLAAALEWLARHTRESADITVTVDTLGDASLLPPAVASVLYRVAQEALGNVVRHAAASSVVVLLRVGAETATLEVADDGRGFDVEEAEARRPGMGLFSMQERVALVNGHLDVTSAPGDGTRVVASVPFVPRRQL